MANEVDNLMAATTETETQIVGTFPQIIVTGTAEKPYYQIMYLENEDGEVHLGYGSYDLAYVLEWLEEFFGVTRASAVNPESLRPKGHWNIRSSRDLFPDKRRGCRPELFFLECSECRRKVLEGVDQDAARNGEYRKLVERLPYCHCGCKMEV